jgi:hypothetical protein
LNANLTEPDGGRRMALGDGDLVGLISTRTITVALEQRSEIESAVRIAAVERAAVTALGVGQIASLLQQHTEVQRRACMPPAIGLPIRELGGGHVATLLEQQPQVESLGGLRELVRSTVSPSHLPTDVLMVQQ